ncbi:hypothetical protein ACLB2K_032947 [Fragaria x ananassa]
MGIQGLLPLLKSIMEPIHIKDLKGCSVAIDTYSWLHKGALSCSRELCKGIPTSRHIDYCMYRVNLLQHYGVKPILVFDGGLLPMKGEQENKRARARKENFARAIEHDSNGNSSAAYECYQKAVDISPSIAVDLIQVLKRENVSYVVAPYEADAQMTFLAVSKQVEAVITEDSDLIPFGCPRIIYKMDKFGQGVEFQYSRLPRNKDLSFAGFTKQMVLEMCILSGCDYLQSLPGMGLKRAHALIKKFTSYDKVIKHLKYSMVSVPPLYEESFKKAILTFQHQRVYDPVSQDIVHLSDLSEDIEENLDFLGPSIPQHIAKGIAEGDLDPFTNMPFQQQEENITANTSSRPKNVNFGNTEKKLDLPVQNNLLTKYFCFASLEAKRKFRAPRSSPDDPSPVSSSSLSPDEGTSVDDAFGSSLSLHEHVSVDDAICTTNCSKSILLYPENNGNTPHSDSVEDSFPTDLSESPNDDMAGKAISPDSTLLPQSRHSIHKSCLTLHIERECKNAQGTFEGKTRTENRKVIVRSSYFKDKSRNENIEEDKQESLLSKDSLASDMHENVDPESAPFGKSQFSRKLVKRKISPNYNVQEDDVKPKQLCTNASLPHNGPSSNEATFTDIKTEEGKFGSNISHLGQYSDIAEKSMENFVSVISSLRFGSSGSRASGLRAPLKDVRNTCTNRTTVGADFSQFEYVPNNQKTKTTARKHRI